MLPVPSPPIGIPANSPSSIIGMWTRLWPTESHGTPMPRRQATAGMTGQAAARLPAEPSSAATPPSLELDPVTCPPP